MAELKTTAELTQSIENVIADGKTFILKVLKGEIGEARRGMQRPLPKSYIPTFNLFGIDALNINGGANNLFSIPHTDYYLELYYGTTLVTTIGFPFNPSAIQIDTMSSVRLTHTANAVYREGGLSRSRNISISGKSGYKPRLGYARDGGYIFENGEVIMHEFDEFLKGYHYLLSLSSSNTYLNRGNFKAQNFPWVTGDNKNITLDSNTLEYYNNEKPFDSTTLNLVLRCVNENISLRVEVSGFNYSKNVQNSRFGYDYSLSLNSYGIWGPGRRSNFYLDLIDNATGYVNKANTALALLEAMNINLANNYIAPLNKPIMAANNVLNQLSKTIESFGAVSGAVFEVANNSVNLFQRIDNTILTTNTEQNAIYKSGNTVVENFKTQLKSVKDNAYRDIESRAENRRRVQKQSVNENDIIILDTIELAVRTNDQVIDSKNIEITKNMLKNVDYTDALSDDNKIELGILTSTLNTIRYQFENIKSIIPRDFISINRELDEVLSFGEYDGIIGLNDNSIPIKLFEGEGLKDVARRLYGNPNRFIDLQRYNGWIDAYRKGDGSYATEGDIIKIPAVDNKLNFIDNIFYTDLAYNLDEGDLRFNSAKNDLYLISNINNLNQSIINTFLTYEGELETALNVGLAGIIGVKNLEFVKTQIQNALLSDERIINAIVNDVKQVQDMLHISLSITAADGQILNFDAPIEM